MNGKKVFLIVAMVVGGILLAGLLGLLLGLVVMWLWNWLMTDLFGLPAIDYWQAVGLFVLAHLLFKSHLGHGHEHHDHHCRPRHDTHDRLKEKVSRWLNDEECREQTGHRDPVEG